MAPTTRSKARALELSKPSHLLELPAELRHYIYELAFTTKYEDGDKINLLTAEPPSSKALLLVCRQVYNEASLLYKTAYRKFWAESDFVIDGRQLETSASVDIARDSIRNMNTSCLDHISNLEVMQPVEMCYAASLTLFDKRGGWFYPENDCYVVPRRHAANYPTVLSWHYTTDSIKVALEKQSSSSSRLDMRAQLLFWLGVDD